MTDQPKILEKLSNHRDLIKRLIRIFTDELLNRAYIHDRSKLESIELNGFSKYDQKRTTFGTKKYLKQLRDKEFQKAINHHYRNNRHHPEHFKNKISGMNLIDFTEMFFDWIASSLEDEKGNPINSIEVGKRRFKINKQVIDIMKNTLKVEAIKNVLKEYKKK